jgi:thiamine-monophosphate kinase
MADGEMEFVRWLLAGQGRLRPWSKLGVGDDMAILEVGGTTVLLTADMLLDGIHFQAGRQPLAAIGRKAVACSLSDCAAMAARPLAATVSVALPRSLPMHRAQELVQAMRQAADSFGCDLVGGDTTRWDHPLAIDVCMAAGAYPGIAPVRRSGARPGDMLVVTGPLGGSLLGKHLTFTPRVAEARNIAEALGPNLHALMDISDGLSLDLARMGEASGAGARLDEEALAGVISDAAQEAARADGRSPLDHALNDGEDFELLAALSEDVDRSALDRLGLVRIGVMTERDFVLVDPHGRTTPVKPGGYDHFDG